MSHYHCEIVLPPTAEKDLEKAVGRILAPFDENASDEEASGKSFWDFWVIGGRFAGSKIQAACGEEGIARFYAWAKEQRIMVKGLQCGKQEIASEDQRRAVDEMWSEMFPAFRGPCPLFNHSNDQYDSNSRMPLDVCKLSEVPAGLTAARFILANAEMRATHMLTTSYWNGVTWEDCKWSGSFSEAMADTEKRLGGYREEWRAKNTPTADWLVVTVDYHS